MKIKFNYKKEKIQNIKIGDWVKSLNPVTGEVENKKVLNTFRPVVDKKSQRLVRLSDGGYIINSEKHPILVEKFGELVYKKFNELMIGDIVIRNDGVKILIASLEKNLNCDENEFYDLEVEGNHNFFAGFGTLICNHNSATIYLPFYHMEVELFSQLSDSKGTVETRARHTDQSIIINKWFLRKALNKEDIYLFHMNEVPELYDALGNENKFNEIYENYAEKVKARHKKKVNAWNLLELFLYERMICGRLYFVFADNSYKGSYKENLYSSNLCLEILQCHTPLDGYNIHTQKHKDVEPEIGVCILANMNLGYAKEEDIPKCASYLVRFLDEMIDISDYGIAEVEYAATKRRALGIGISNLFGFLAKNKMFYNEKTSRKEVNRLMELFSYNLHKASIELAKERGSCELIKDTVYADGTFPHERFTNPEFKPSLNWDLLRSELKQYGIRNSSLVAVPPAGNSSAVSNSTNGVEPPRELVTKKSDKNTSFNKLVPFYKQFKNYYTTAWGEDFNNSDYLKMIACIQHYVDQAISLNLYTNTEKVDKISIGEMIDLLVESFNLGIKTWYYQNFRTTFDIDGLKDDSQEGCASGGCSV